MSDPNEIRSVAAEFNVAGGAVVTALRVAADEIERLQAENERMRLSLQAIEDMAPATQEMDLPSMMADAARAALAQKEG